MLKRFFDSPWPYFALAAVLALVAVASMFELDLPERPVGEVEDIAALAERDDLNVVFILIDTLRADHLSTYGYERPTSPMLDQVAGSGIRFETAIAQSTWTKTSMASLWTSTYPARNGILRWGHALTDEVTLPAEIFKRHGYRTAALFRNGWVAPNFGFDQGFDNYTQPVPGRSPDRFARKTPSASALLGTDEDVTKAAEQFMRTFGEEKFFLYLHYMDVHQFAYDARSAQFGTEMRDFYDNAIHWTDRNLAVLASVLEELELSDRTILVVASDHGEGFKEHGHEGHARTLYREVTHVPLVLSLPFRIEGGVVVEEVAQNVDIIPTLFDILGFEDELPGQQGHSLVPAIQRAASGESPKDDRAAIAHLDRMWGQPTLDPMPIVSLTQDRMRLIRTQRASGEVVRDELFDLELDPWETENLATERTEDLTTLGARLDAYLQEDETPAVAPKTVDIDDMMKGQLQALGYVEE